MSIEQHPLSNGKLGGDLLSHSTYNATAFKLPAEAADWRTTFCYPLGNVELRTTNNGQTYHYDTVIYSEVDRKSKSNVAEQQF